jgi:hypothetical protein
MSYVSSSSIVPEEEHEIKSNRLLNKTKNSYFIHTLKILCDHKKIRGSLIAQLPLTEFK